MITSATSNSRVDFQFLAKHFAERAARFPVESDFYERLYAYYARRRKAQHDAWVEHLPRVMPAANIDYYNERFARVAEITAPLIAAAPIPDEMKQRATEIFAYRIAPGGRFEDLVAADAFHPQTYSMEFRPERAFDAVDKIPAVHGPDVYHLFLHRAQQSEFLYLHEIFVGYFMHLTTNQGAAFADRRALSLFTQPNFFSLSDYAVRSLARIVGRTPETVAALHFADGAQLRRDIPAAILDVMTMASHIYWYFDFMNAKLKLGYDAGPILSVVDLFYVIPALERFEADPSVRVDSDAGRRVDRAFTELGSRPEPPNQIDCVRLLVHLSDTLWARL